MVGVERPAHLLPDRQRFVEAARPVVRPRLVQQPLDLRRRISGSAGTALLLLGLLLLLVVVVVVVRRRRRRLRLLHQHTLAGWLQRRGAGVERHVSRAADPHLYEICDSDETVEVRTDRLVSQIPPRAHTTVYGRSWLMNSPSSQLAVEQRFARADPGV